MLERSLRMPAGARAQQPLPRSSSSRPRQRHARRFRSKRLAELLEKHARSLEEAEGRALGAQRGSLPGRSALAGSDQRAEAGIHVRCLADVTLVPSNAGRGDGGYESRAAESDVRSRLKGTTDEH